MAEILHHLGCPKRPLNWYKTNIWGILSGAGFFPSTVGMEKYGISFQMIQFVTFLSPIVGGHLTFEGVT